MKKILLLLSIAIISSCSVFFGKGVALKTSKTLSNVLEFRDSTGGKTVVLLPMCHYGKMEDYQKIRSFLDGLKESGYVTFVEGFLRTDRVFDPDETYTMRYMLDPESKIGVLDSLVADTLSRKLRRLLGLNLNAYYSDKTKRKGFVRQDHEILGLDTDRDIWVDMTSRQLFDKYEERGQIRLTEYDFQCDLNSPDYNLRKSSKTYHSLFALLYIRDNYLLERILKSDYDKIAVVYGSMHIRDLKWLLKRNNYTRVR